MSTELAVCEHQGCTHAAAGQIGIAFYPPKSLMKHYGKTYDAEGALTIMATSLKVCREHFDAFNVDDIIKQPTPAGNSTFIETFAPFIERTSKTKVDAAATRKILLPFNDKMVGILEKQREKK